MSHRKSVRLPLLLTAAVATAAALGFAGCNQPSPVNFTVTVPAPNEISFRALLTQQYGIGLSGTFALPNNVGTVTLTPEAPGTGFGMGLDLNTSAFLKSTWVQYGETTTLPNGGAFPTWINGPLVDVTSQSLDQPGVKFHFYFGVHAQWYAGVAGVISAINNGNFPNVNVGYTFYDQKGNVVIGFQFFGPSTTSPGGIFIGTNLTPFIPATPHPAQLLELVERSNAGLPVEINGQSVVADVVTSGPDAHRYRSERKIRDLIYRFTAASRGER